jgi:SAM-dependent methyltransferase
MATDSTPDPELNFLKPASRCPICESRRIYYAFATGEARVVRCEGCGFMFLNPQPSDGVLANIYGRDYFLGTDAPEFSAQVAALKARTAASYLDAAAPWIPSGAEPTALLEIGCGDGHLLVEAERRGYNVTGVEYSPHSAARAQAKLKRGKVFVGDLESQSLPDASFDICILADVIEHVRDPRETLRLLWRKIRPGGLLLVATPSRDSWSAHLMGSHWMEFKTEHLSYFSRNTIEALLSQAGFETLFTRPGYKWVSLRYVAAHFAKYPVPIWSRLVATATRVTPDSIQLTPVRVAGSGLLSLARKGVQRPRPLVSIVVPVYNERATITELLGKLDAKQLQGADKEVIVVESNSTDGSRAIVERYRNLPGYTVILEDAPRGKGAATRAGIAAAQGEIVMIQDADLEYDMDDYDALLEPILSGRHAFVLGARHGGAFWKMRQFRGAYGASVVMNLAHWAFTWMINVSFLVYLRDPFTMYKIFRRDCVTGLKFQCNRFDFDWEILILLIRRGYRPIEIPVNYRSRSFAEGKKVRFLRDPLTWLYALARLRLVPLRSYLTTR